jgi:hypothetical protein
MKKQNWFKRVVTSVPFLTLVAVGVAVGIAWLISIRMGTFIQGRAPKQPAAAVATPSIANMFIAAQDWAGALGMVSPSDRNYRSLQVLKGYKSGNFSHVEDSQLRSRLEADYNNQITAYSRTGPKNIPIKVGVSWFAFKFDDDLKSDFGGFDQRIVLLQKLTSELDELGVDYIVWNMQNVWETFDLEVDYWWLPFDRFFDVLANSNLQVICNTNENFQWSGDFQNWETIKARFYDPAFITAFVKRYKDRTNKQGEVIIRHWMLGGDRANNFDWLFWLKPDANWQLHSPAEVKTHNENTAKIYTLISQICDEVGRAILAGDKDARLTLCCGAGNRVVEWFEYVQKRVGFEFYGVDVWGPHYKYADYKWTFKNLAPIKVEWKSIWQTGWNYISTPKNDYHYPEKNIYDPTRVKEQAKLYRRIIPEVQAAGFDGVAIGLPLFIDAPYDVTCCYSFYTPTPWPGQSIWLWKGKTWQRNENYQAIYETLRK